MIGRRESRGAVAVVRTLAARWLPWAYFSFSRASAALAAFRLFLKQNRMIDRTDPISNRIPIANPAFPPALIPPSDAPEVEESDVALEVAAETVVELDGTLPVAARRASVVPREVEGAEITVGREEVEAEVASVVCFADLTEEDVSAWIFTAAEDVLVFGVGTTVVVGSGDFAVLIATPKVVYPPISPLKVGDAVT